MSDHVQHASTHSQEVAVAITKATPPAGASALYLAGVQLETWVVILTLVYTSLLILHQLYKMYHDVKERRYERKCKRR